MLLHLILMNIVAESDTWYQRMDNNGWRPVVDSLILASRMVPHDAVTTETEKHPVPFHHSILRRRTDMMQRRKRVKIKWMKQL